MSALVQLREELKQQFALTYTDLVQWIDIATYRWMKPGEEVRLCPGVGTIALDGEREIELSATSVVDVRLFTDGPLVVDVPAALQEAALAGYLHRRHNERK